MRQLTGVCRSGWQPASALRLSGPPSSVSQLNAPSHVQHPLMLLFINNLGLWLPISPCADYAFALAPGQTPYRDQYFIEKIIGIGENDGVQARAVAAGLHI